MLNKNDLKCNLTHKRLKFFAKKKASLILKILPTFPKQQEKKKI